MDLFPVTGLPDVEAQAMRLDGEAYRLGDEYVPVWIPDAPAVRAASLMRQLPDRVIASRTTAAWVWGAPFLGSPGTQYMTRLAARWQPPGGTLDIIEAVIDADDVVEFSGGRVTTPLRTLLDIARFQDPFTDVDAACVRYLAELASLTTTRIHIAVTTGRRHAGYAITLERVEEALAGQPELTR